MTILESNGIYGATTSAPALFPKGCRISGRTAYTASSTTVTINETDCDNVVITLSGTPGVVTANLPNDATVYAGRTFHVSVVGFDATNYLRFRANGDSTDIATCISSGYFIVRAKQTQPTLAAHWEVVTNDRFQFADGTAALPAIVFGADPDTGIYRIGSGNVGFSANGVKIGEWSAAGAWTLGTTVLAGYHLLQAKPSDHIPLWVQNHNSADTCIIRLTSTSANTDLGLSGGEAYWNAITSATGGAAVYVNASNQLTTSSSLRATKTNWQDLKDVSWLERVPCGSFQYKRKVDGKWTDEIDEDAPRFFGSYFEDMMEICPQVCFDYGLDNNGERRAGIEYSRFIIPLVRANQLKTDEIDALRAELAAIKAKVSL